MQMYQNDHSCLLPGLDQMVDILRVCECVDHSILNAIFAELPGLSAYAHRPVGSPSDSEVTHLFITFCRHHHHEKYNNDRSNKQ